MRAQQLTWLRWKARLPHLLDILEGIPVSVRVYTRMLSSLRRQEGLGFPEDIVAAEVEATISSCLVADIRGTAAARVEFFESCDVQEERKVG